MKIGSHHTEEWKKAQSERAKGKHNGGTFKKGHKPWHKDKKGVYSEETIAKMSEAKIGLFVGDKNFKWKGDKVGYSAIHTWMSRQRGKPDYCERCKRSDLPHRHYNWANISGKYRRDVSDWIRLCVKCHKNYDLGKINL